MSRHSRRRPTFIDLFSGAGLFSGGMIAAGLKPVLAIECDELAAKSYARNVHTEIQVASVTEVRAVPAADVLIAGPPCQGFSTLGRCDPTDLRNELSLAVLPWAKFSQARIVVVENVPPFVRSAQWKRLSRGLKRLGYEISTWDLDAVDFGTPQRRRRSFTIASKIGAIEEPRAKTTMPLTVRDALEESRIRFSDPMHVWPTPTGIAAERIALVPPCGDKRDLSRIAPHLCPPSWKRVGCNATDVWGRIDPNGPANTLRCAFQNPSKGRYLHPTENRVLSLREGARLQGIPDSWMFEGRRYPAARQIGNGVPIPLAKAVGKSLVQALS